MVPRPRPEDSSSLFQASPDEKPFLHDSHSRGRERRRSSLLLLSGWNGQAPQDDDATIELTVCSSDSCRDDEDPLFSSLGSAPQELHGACLYDGEIAALMAAEWDRQDGIVPPPQPQAYTKTRADEPWTWLEKMACGLMTFLVGTLILVLCVYSIQHGSGAARKMGRYHCPASLQEILIEFNRTQQECHEDETGTLTCPCQDFSLPTAVPLEVSRLEQESKQLLLVSHQALDVVFLGRLFDDNDDKPSWMEDSLYGIEMGRRGELPSTILNRFDQELLLPVSPKVWWISLGGGTSLDDDDDDDILSNECAMNAIQAGIAHLVQRITKEQPQARIVLSPPPPSPKTRATSFNKRLECLAATSTDDNGSRRIEYYNPFRVHHHDAEQDDDFFMDVASATITKTAVTTEEAQQAVVLKLQKLLH